MTTDGSTTNADMREHARRALQTGTHGVPHLQRVVMAWIDGLIAQAEGADRAVAEARVQAQAEPVESSVPPERMGDFGSWQLIEHREWIPIGRARPSGHGLALYLCRSGNGHWYARIESKGESGTFMLAHTPGTFAPGGSTVDLPQARELALAWARGEIATLAKAIGVSAEDLGHV